MQKLVSLIPDLWDTTKDGDLLHGGGSGGVWGELAQVIGGGGVDDKMFLEVLAGCVGEGDEANSKVDLDEALKDGFVGLSLLLLFFSVFSSGLLDLTFFSIFFFFY